MTRAPEDRLGRRYGRTNYGIVLISFVVVVAPSNILGLAFGVFYAAVSRLGSQRFLPLILSASLFLASYNSTKKPVSDLYFYELASNALSQANFDQFLLLHGHEPGYYFINWIYVHEFGFDWNSWVLVFSFFFYFLWLNGLAILQGVLNLDRASSLALLVWAAFFPLVFLQSAHLVRQYIAASIGLLGMARFLTDGRGLIYFLLAPVFHVVALVLLVVPMSARLARRSRRAAILFTLLGPLLLVLGGRTLGQNLERLEAIGLPSIITYGIGRLSQNQFYELEEVSLIAVVFSLVVLGISLSGLALGVAKSVSPSTRVSSRFAAFVAFNAVLAASIIVFSQVGLSEPATRLFQFLILQFPFLLTIFLSVFWAFRLFALFTGFLMPFVFFIYPNAWTYADLPEILTLPHYVYLFGG